MSYKRFSQLEFVTKKHKTVCETLLSDIQNLESQLVYDDEIVEYIKEKVGSNAAEASSGYIGLNRRLLTGLKLSFWYYTGVDPGKVILDTVVNKEKIDIFNPLDS